MKTLATPPSTLIKAIIENSHGVLSRIEKPTKDFVGRESEVNAVLECLYKKRMKNCVLVGNAGVGKTEIAKQAIHKLARKEVFLNMSVGSLQSGCTLVGMFEQKLDNILKPIFDYNEQAEGAKISLFIDEIHTLWRANDNQYSGTIGAADLLKPHLSSGKLTIIGTTTYDEYKEYVFADKALLRRLPPVFVSEMDDETIAKIIRKFSENQLSEELIAKIIQESKSVPYLSNPDCSLEIADRIMARALSNGRLPNESDAEEVTKLMKGVFENV